MNRQIIVDSSSQWKGWLDSKNTTSPRHTWISMQESGAEINPASRKSLQPGFQARFQRDPSNSSHMKHSRDHKTVKQQWGEISTSFCLAGADLPSVLAGLPLLLDVTGAVAESKHYVFAPGIDGKSQGWSILVNRLTAAAGETRAMWWQTLPSWKWESPREVSNFCLFNWAWV